MKVVICVLQQEFNIEVGVQEPVTEIKKKIEQHLGIPTASQTLSVSDWELLDGLDMEDYPIVTEGTKINLTITSQTSTKIQIIINFSSRQHIMDVEKTETVQSLREKIHILDGMPIKTISLFFCGTELEDEHCSLSEYGIRELSEIAVFRKTTSSASTNRSPKDERLLSLVIQTSSSLLNGASIPLQVSNSSTVNDLRQWLLSQKILPLDDYLFVHRQRIMRDYSSLKWHGVEDGDFLFLFKGTVTPGEL